MLKRILHYTVPAAATVFFLYLALRHVNLQEVGSALYNTSPLMLLLTLAMAVLSIAIRAWRWQQLLKPLRRVTYPESFAYSMIGFMANNVLPAHAGEFVKTAFLARREKVPFSSVLATVILERIFDVMALVVLLVTFLLSYPVPSWLKSGGSMVSLAIFLLVSILMFSTHRDNWLKKVLLKISEMLPEKVSEIVGRQIHGFFAGLEIFSSRKVLVEQFLVSLLLWLQISATVFIIYRLFPLSGLTTWEMLLASGITIVILAFAIVLPSSPGYFGVMQLAFVVALKLFGIRETDAVACSIIFNLTQYLPITVLGLLFLFKEGLSLQDLRTTAEQKNETAD